MASFSYLWSNRAKFKFGSKKYFKAWGKRIIALPELLQRNYRRFKLISQGSRIHQSTEVGRVTVDGHKNKLSVGALSFIGRVYIALHEDVIIGERVCINDGVEILTASHDVNDPHWKHTKAAIVIEDYAWIGTGAMLLPGVKIGRGAVIGARAVVTKSVEAGTIVVGNPAKEIVRRRPQNLNYNPCEFLAGNQAWLFG
ncbi:MAG: acyltransferase [Pyrinomonadaceae bacterium]|nr:acyltransferase [Sphingobacteriaceae bacterium]